MAIRIADLFTAGEQGRQAARDTKARKGLAAYLQGDQSAIGQVYAADPNSAFAAEGMVNQRKQQAEERLGRVSAAFAQSRDPILYQQWREAAMPVLGQRAAGMPESLSDPADIEGAVQAATSFARAYGGAQDNTPAAIRELQMLQANPELAELDMKRRTAGFDRPQLIQTESGYAWATPDGARPLTYEGGAPAAAPQSDQSVIQRNLAMLGAQPGVQMTSGLRTPERNQAVGGQPNSQHLRGTAGDYVVPQHQKAAFIQQAQAQGLQAIDEGDHIHVQVPRGAPAQSNVVMPPRKGEITAYQQEQLALARERLQIAQQAREQATAAKQDAAAAKDSAKRVEMNAKQVEAATQANDLITAIDALTSHPGFNELGTALGDVKRSTPLIRSDVKDADAQLRNIGGQVALTTMSRLKALSSSGATGFGALSEKELALLQNSIATLQSDNISNAQIKASLKVIREKMEKIADWKGDQPQDNDVDALIGKYL